MYVKETVVYSLYQLQQKYPNTSFSVTGPNADWLAENGYEVYTAPPVEPDPEVAEAQRIASLWQAAHNYEYAEISGSAVGLLAIGVMQGLPKCIAVQNWIKSIWAEYYIRKAGSEVSTDYSGCGTCPHTVPELMVELGL